MKRWLAQIFMIVAALCLVLAACRTGRLIAVGIDESGRAIATTFDEQVYQTRLTNAMLTVNDAVLKGVQAINRSTEDIWDLQIIVVGVNVDAEFGFGPFKFGVIPGIKAYFTYNDHPPSLP